MTHALGPAAAHGPVFEDVNSMRTAVATLRVLVVDDEPLIRWAISQTLEQAGHEVVDGGDAAAALERLVTGPPPDVVLLDLRLPDSNDLTLLGNVRRLAPSAAVVMMTAVGMTETVDAARRLGAYRVVTKPIDMRELETIVLAAVDSRS